MSMDSIAQRAANALRTPDKTLFKPLISISIIPQSESSTLHLLAVSQSGRINRSVIPVKLTSGRETWY